MTRSNRFKISATAATLALLMAWPSDAIAQRGGGGRGSGQPSGGRGGGQAVSRPSGGQPATGRAIPRPPGSSYPGRGGYYGGYRPYYGNGGYYSPYYRGYYSSYYRGYYSPYYWGAGWGWGWGASYAWGYPSYYGYPHYPYPSYPYYYFDPAVDLRLEVTPRDAEVYLDGYLVGVVDNFDGMLQRLRVPYGEHEITIYFSGYRSIQQKMLFRPGESYRIKQVMEPVAAGDPADPRPTPSAPPPERADRGRPPTRGYAEPPTRGEEPPVPGRGQPDMSQPGVALGDFGSLAIKVQPAGAEIIVDGERWEVPAGDDRLTLDLSSGPHKIEIRKEGYKPYSAEVNIVRGRTWPLNVSLPKSD